MAILTLNFYCSLDSARQIAQAVHITRSMAILTNHTFAQMQVGLQVNVIFFVYLLLVTANPALWKWV